AHAGAGLQCVPLQRCLDAGAARWNGGGEPAGPRFLPALGGWAPAGGDRARADPVPLGHAPGAAPTRRLAVPANGELVWRLRRRGGAGLGRPGAMVADDQRAAVLHRRRLRGRRAGAGAAAEPPRRPGRRPPCIAGARAGGANRAGGGGSGGADGHPERLHAGFAGGGRECGSSAVRHLRHAARKFHRARLVERKRLVARSGVSRHLPGPGAGGSGQRRARHRRRRHAADRPAARLHRRQRLRRANPRWTLAGGHGPDRIRMAGDARGAVLGAALAARSLSAAGVRDRERLLRARWGGGRWQGPRPGAADFYWGLRGRPAASHRRRHAGTGISVLVAARQLRVASRLHPALRPGVRGLRDRPPRGEGLGPKVCRNSVSGIGAPAVRGYAAGSLVFDFLMVSTVRVPFSSVPVSTTCSPDKATTFFMLAILKTSPDGSATSTVSLPCCRHFRTHSTLPFIVPKSGPTYLPFRTPSFVHCESMM